MSTEAAVPSLDISAALQAAVAAAAELARVGLSDDLAAAFASPGAAPAMTVAAAPPTREPVDPPATIQQPQLVPVAPAPSPVVVVQVQQLQQQQQKPVSPSAESSASDQCTGQDAAGDQQEPAQRNDMSLSTAGDAAGERTFEESEEDAAKRLARSRERNREHARRTRLRKKAQLEALQSKVRELEAEKKSLKLKIEECSIASILINLAEPSAEEQQAEDASSLLDATMQRQDNQRVSDAKISLLTAGKRKRFASVDTSEENKAPQTLTLKIDGQTTVIGPRSSINWKSGVYSDENGVQRQLTSEQLEGLRRERNRMHAKMTRDRKKNFIATIEKTIEQLERDCQKMRDILNKVGAQKQEQKVLTAPVTPLMTPRQEDAAGKSAAVVIAATAPVPAVAATHAFLAPVQAPAPTPSLLVPIPAPAPTPTLLVASAAQVPTPSPSLLVPVSAPAPTPSLLLPSLAAAVASVQAPIAAVNTENPPKRAKVSHGFSWNG